MSPSAVAKLYCANWHHGACLGLSYDDKLRLKSVHPLPRCLLIEPIERCIYFEENVAPNHIQIDHERKAFEEGVRQYRKAIK